MSQFGLVVRFALRPGRAEAFDALMRDTVAGIAAHEPRTLAYAVHALAGEPDVRIFYELYTSEDALAEHESQTTTCTSSTASTTTSRAWTSSDCAW